jgi:hypothetical protein
VQLFNKQTPPHVVRFNHKPDQLPANVGSRSLLSQQRNFFGREDKLPQVEREARLERQLLIGRDAAGLLENEGREVACLTASPLDLD